MTKATTKKKKTKQAPAEQLKMEGTGRLDSVEAIEKAAKAYQDKVALREQAQVAEDDARDELTAALIANNKTEYVYEGKDGKPYCAYVPSAEEPKAKVRKVKRNKPDLGDGEN